MSKSNPQQDALAALPIGNVLVIAPAGCGKTEALAARSKAVLDRMEVPAPQKILALTFSTKACDNLSTRMRTVVGSGWGQRIQVRNLHGLGSRVIKAHGSAVGIARDVILPEESWLARKRRELGIDYRNGRAFDAALASAKAGRLDDDEVMARLEATGNGAAVAFEQALRAENRLDHDDVIRHAARLLAIPAVLRLYRAHFGMVMVDEVQDLSLLQFEMVRAVGGDTVTYAGDPAQGIYTFAGADATGVFAAIRALSPEVVKLNQSYRSAPEVLNAVNALAKELAATQLVCGDPDRWKKPGYVVSIERANTTDEAAALLRIVKWIGIDPNASIGIIGRGSSRLVDLRTAATETGVPFEDWGVASHDPQVVELLKHYVRQVVAALGEGIDAVDELERCCREAVDPTDARTLDAVVSACDELRDVVEAGSGLGAAVAACRSSPMPDAPVAPGVHFLTGHKGKGQEFDWVFVIGLEDDHVPDWRNKGPDQLPEELRVLHVMVSRARFGVVFTYSRQVWVGGRWRSRAPSPWLEVLRSAATRTNHK